MIRAYALDRTRLDKIGLPIKSYNLYLRSKNKSPSQEGDLGGG